MQQLAAGFLTMPDCCAVSCSNEAEDGFTLFNIPRGIRNGARREVWLQNIHASIQHRHQLICWILLKSLGMRI